MYQRLFFAVLEGPGLVFLESMSFHKFKRIMQPTTAELAAAQAMATDTSAEDGPDEPDMGPR